MHTHIHPLAFSLIHLIHSHSCASSLTDPPFRFIHLLNFKRFRGVFGLDQIAFRLVHQANLVALRLQLGFLLVAFGPQHLKNTGTNNKQ